MRLQVRIASANGESQTSVGIASRGGVVAGDTKRYQCWYRITFNPPCGVGAGEFKLTSGYGIVLLP